MGRQFHHFILLAWIAAFCANTQAQELQSPQWQIGPLSPKSAGIWPQPDSISQDDENGFELIGFGTLQYSPGAQLQGFWLGWPSAGGAGWQLGSTWNWDHGKWKSSGMIEHWRVAGVNVDDWNEAWQWGTWNGMGWAWNPNQADIGLLRAVGSVQYQVSPSVHLEAGSRRHHWGNGWRSIWLDRQAAPLPFLRIHLQTERIQYTHLIGKTLHRSVGSPADFPGSGQLSPAAYVNKRSSWLAAHVVDAKITSSLIGSLFGAVTWLGSDVGYTHRFEAAYALPIIAFRPEEYSLGSADNAMVGASLTYEPELFKSRVRFYGQLTLDELVVSEIFSPDQWWANKWALLGSSSWASVNEEWHAVAEVCAVRPYTFAHTAPAQAWTHNRQPLAHPAGSNFAEARIHIRWDRAPWHAHFGVVQRRQGREEQVELDDVPEFSIGSDPLLSYASRPADYGVGLMWDGNGLAGQTDVVNQQLLWLDIGYEIPKLDDQQFFIRAMRNRELGSITDKDWWRLECGIRLNRVLEERNW
ncbi:MAG: hypothetical protein O2818_04315 [Bacteroidetes bacterium]|nr:hypothetical protein [Bacteroidota bacterium]